MLWSYYWIEYLNKSSQINAIFNVVYVSSASGKNLQQKQFNVIDNLYKRKDAMRSKSMVKGALTATTLTLLLLTNPHAISADEINSNANQAEVSTTQSAPRAEANENKTDSSSTSSKATESTASNKTFKASSVTAKNAWVYDKDSQNWYFFNEKGQPLTNAWKGSYYLKSNGQMAKSEWVESPETGWHYFSPNGTYVMNKWVGDRYLKQWGYMAKNQWLYDNEAKAWYFVDENGHRLTNTYKGGYYLKDDGKMASGEWVYNKDIKNWYYINANGTMAKNVWKGAYYLKENGEMAKSEWVKSPETGWHYFNPNGTYAMNKWVDGRYIKNWGYLAQNEWIFDKEANNWFFVNEKSEAVTNTWKGAYYLKENGEMAKGEWIVSPQTGRHYINADGKYAQEQWVGPYYLKKWGYMAKGEWAKSPETGWHYFNEDGTYVQNKWVGDYYLKQWGYMAKNCWVEIDGTWYYFRDNGTKQTGWRKLGGRHYYFGADGKLANGTYGQTEPNKLIDLPGYYISPLLADENNTRSERIEAMIQTAMTYLGTTYKPCCAGAPGTCCDCSGLVMQSLYAAGYNPYPISPKRHALPEYEYESRSFWADSRIPTVPASQIQRGDLVFYHNGYGTVIHIAIYLGDGTVIEEWPPYGMIRPLNWSPRPHILGYKRVF